MRARAEADDPPPGVDPDSAAAAAAAAEREAQDIAAGNDTGGVFRRMHLYQRLVPSRHTLQMLDTDAAILQARAVRFSSGSVALVDVRALSFAKGEMATLHRMIQRLNADTSLAEGQNEEAEGPVTSLSQDCMLAQQQLDELLALNRGAASALLRHEEELIDGLGQFDAMLSASGRDDGAAGSSDLLLGLRRLEDEVARKVTETTEQVFACSSRAQLLGPML